VALRKLRKTMKPVIWVVTVAFVISIFFIGAAGSMSNNNRGDGLTVNGKKVSQLKNETAVSDIIDKYQNYFKGAAIDYDAGRYMTIGNLIETQFLVKEATAQEKKVDEKVLKDRLNQMTGIEDEKRLKQVLKNRNMSIREIKRDVSDDIIAEKVRERLKTVTLLQ
jgi:peptidyl-prolyl cis-trans isomerase D